jgi:hypothetical protein
MKKMVVVNTIKKQIPLCQIREKEINIMACKKVGVQLLNFCSQGSPNDPTMPPIESGYLRGSGSVFVGSELVGTSPKPYGKGDPLRSFSIGQSKEGQTIISIIYNTEYAARLHETKWKPGGVIPSKAARNNPSIIRNVGNKWIERHLKADAKDLMWLYGEMIKKEFLKGIRD